MLATLILAATLFANAELIEQSPMQPQLSITEKMAKLRPLVKAATDCVITAVNNDPRINVPGSKVNDLIVAAFPQCITPTRAMISAHDSYFGSGTGEAFFMGPYLDVLPKAVQDAHKKEAGPPP